MAWSSSRPLICGISGLVFTICISVAGTPALAYDPGDLTDPSNPVSPLSPSNPGNLNSLNSPVNIENPSNPLYIGRSTPSTSNSDEAGRERGAIDLNKLFGLPFKN